MAPDESTASAWILCRAWGETVQRIRDRDPKARTAQDATFRAWTLGSATATSFLRILWCLSLYAALQDVAGPSGDVLNRMPVTAVAEDLITRPTHEFFAGLDGAPLDTAEETAVAALRLLVYDTRGTSPLTLRRLCIEARSVLLRIARTLPPDRDACGDLLRLTS